jgi:hypothetical protein
VFTEQLSGQVYICEIQLDFIIIRSFRHCLEHISLAVEKKDLSQNFGYSMTWEQLEAQQKLAPAKAIWFIYFFASLRANLIICLNNTNSRCYTRKGLNAVYNPELAHVSQHEKLQFTSGLSTSEPNNWPGWLSSSKIP